MLQANAKPILIIQTAFIGDTILASSFARSVHEAYPEAPIHFLLRKGNETVIQGLPFIHKVWIWDKKAGKIRSLWGLVQEMRQFDFAAVFNLHRHASSGFVTAFMHAAQKIGFRQNPLSFFFTHKVIHRIPHVVSGTAWHEVQRNLRLLQEVRGDIPMPFSLSNHRPVLPLLENHRQKVATYKTKPFVVVAPASVWFTKQWEEAKYTQLVSELSQNRQVYLIGGPGDRELCQRVKGNSSAVNLAGELSLLESAALMQGADRVFVNDSGPLHLASAVNAPTTAVFCATIPEFGYGPLATNAIVLETPIKLACRPCGLHGGTKCPEGHFLCSGNITVAMAKATLGQ